jgi:hypothetical protein
MTFVRKRQPPAPQAEPTMRELLRPVSVVEAKRLKPKRTKYTRREERFERPCPDRRETALWPAR